MEIAEFIPSEQNDVVKFWGRIFNEFNWKQSNLHGKDDVPKYFHFPKGFLFIMKDNDGNIVGSGGIKPLNNVKGILKRFYISSEYRGKGIAKKLLNTIIKESKKRGFIELFLDVYYKNIAAVKFYEKHGFIRYTQKPQSEWNETLLSPGQFYFYKLVIGTK